MRKLFILMCLTSIQLIVKGQNDLSENLIKRTEDFILQKMKSDKIVGLSAALIVNDSIIWEKGFGFADLEKQIPMTENTVVHIGSVTKPITALCAMQLQEKGLLDINQPVTKYLPQFKPKTRFGQFSNITVKDLITHSAGIQTDIWKNSDFKSAKYTDVVEYINNTNLLYPPGVLSLYSNSGYNILGHIIKEVSQMDYPDYVHKNVFKPLGMDNSGFLLIDSLKNRTKIYDKGLNEISDCAIRDIASGGIYCSVHDFALLAKGIINSYHNEFPAILKASTMKEIFTLQNGDVEYVVGKNKRGLGWYLFEKDSYFAVNHTGSAGYAFAHLMIFPKDKAAIMILTNSSNGWDLAEYAGYNILEDFHLKIADVFIKSLIIEENEEFNTITLSKDSLIKHVGYYSEALSYSKVYIENDTLRILRNNELLSIVPKTNNAFIPIDIHGNIIPDIRYYFKDIGPFHALILIKNNSEQVLGYKFHGINTKLWEHKIGEYEHFGYQMIGGDTKFKGVELKLSNDKILLLVLETLENKYSIPLDVISVKYATTAGLMSGYGMTVSFTENEKYDFIDFAGITFRKEK